MCPLLSFSNHIVFVTPKGEAAIQCNPKPLGVGDRIETLPVTEVDGASYGRACELEYHPLRLLRIKDGAVLACPGNLSIGQCLHLGSQFPLVNCRRDQYHVVNKPQTS